VRILVNLKRVRHRSVSSPTTVSVTVSDFPAVASNTDVAFLLGSTEIEVLSVAQLEPSLESSYIQDLVITVKVHHSPHPDVTNPDLDSNPQTRTLASKPFQPPNCIRLPLLQVPCCVPWATPGKIKTWVYHRSYPTRAAVAEESLKFEFYNPSMPYLSSVTASLVYRGFTCSPP
jgi:hypothetical protein